MIPNGSMHERTALPISLVRCLAAALLLLGSRDAFAGDIDDTVYLRNGGRVRGVVLEESPTLGVRLRLPDGTTRNLETAEVDHVTYGSAPLEVRSETARSTIRFGLGVEPVLWYVPATHSASIGARILGRMNVSLSPLVAFRFDLGAAALDSVDGGNAFVQGTTSIPISMRADLQFNLARRYAVGLGVDLGVDVYRVQESLPLPLPLRGLTSSGSVTDAQGMLGIHVSPLTLQLGRTNQLQVAAQEAVLFFLEQGDNPAFEQTVSFTYLFGAPPGS